MSAAIPMEPAGPCTHGAAEPCPRCRRAVPGAPRLPCERIELSLAGAPDETAGKGLARRLERIPGVREALVNAITQRAVVVFDPGIIGAEEFVELLERREGVEVGRSLARWHLRLSGITCASCASRIERAVSRVPGVHGAFVNTAASNLTIEYTPRRTDLSDVRRAVAAEGVVLDVRATPQRRLEALASGGSERSPEDRSLIRRFWLAAAIALPAIVLSHVGRFGIGGWRAPGGDGRRLAWAVLGVLTVPVLTYSAAGFYRGAVSAIRRHVAGMNVLVAAAIGAAWLYSTVAVLFPGLFPASTPDRILYDVVAGVTALAVLGAMLAFRSTRGSSAALARIIARQPHEARVVRNGREQSIPAEEVVIGDTVTVFPGETIPVDGQVIAGRPVVFERAVTGAPGRVEKSLGDTVIAATQNGIRPFRLRATGVGAATVLGRVIRAVEDAQGSKAPVHRGIDVVARVYTPSVMILAIVSAMAWYTFGPSPRATGAVLGFVTVLVFACPGALGLAASAPFLAGIGRAAESGILIHSGAALEAASRVDTVVIDLADVIAGGTPSASARAAARSLHAGGLAVVALTAHHDEAALASARRAGIVQVLEARGAEERVRRVRELQRAGRRVAYVGHSVDDARPLAEAGIGIAIGKGGGVATVGCGITLVRGSLPGIVAAIRLSRMTMRVVRQNLLGVLAYNLIGLPVAAGALYPAFGFVLSPLLAATAMALSALLVVLNANRLCRFALTEVN